MEKRKNAILLIGMPFFFLMIAGFFLLISSLIKEVDGDGTGYRLLSIFGIVFFCLFSISSVLSCFINIMHHFSFVVEGTYSNKNTIYILLSSILIILIIVFSIFIIKKLI